MLLEIFPGVDNLISLDPSCFIVYTYLRVAGIPFQYRYTTSFSQELPFLYTKEKKITGLNAILIYLKTEILNLDQQLSSDQQGLSMCYRTLIEEELLDGVLYSWWLEKENYFVSLKPKLKKLLPWFSRNQMPWHFIGMTRERMPSMETVDWIEGGALDKIEGGALDKTTVELTQERRTSVSPPRRSSISPRRESFTSPRRESSHTPHRESPIDIMDHAAAQPTPLVYVKTKKVYSTLIKKLTNAYFFGESPTTLDVFAYVYLEFHAYPSLNQPRLASLLSFGYPDLLAYLQRMNQWMDHQPHVPQALPRVTLKEQCQEKMRQWMHTLNVTQCYLGKTEHPSASVPDSSSDKPQTDPVSHPLSSVTHNEILKGSLFTGSAILIFLVYSFKTFVKQ